MSLGEDLSAQVKQIFKEKWEQRDGYKVPESADLKLSNDAVLLDGAVLYADIADSTDLVDGRKAFFAAEVYKAFLHCTARIISAESGTVTAYDGDRAMAVFIGDSKETVAVRAAMKAHYAVEKIINPAIKSQYPDETYQLKHVVGIDSSSLFVARTGIRGSNDLVWVGRAANHAAKMSAFNAQYRTYVTKDTYGKLDDSAKLSKGKNMWNTTSLTVKGREVYGSNYWWSL